MREGFGAVAAEKFLEYFRSLRDAYEAETGHEIRDYKPLESDRLLQVFDDLATLKTQGLDFLAEMLHRLVWAQCLGNANHPPTILFLQGFMDQEGVAFPSLGDEVDAQEHFHNDVNRFSDVSHRILDRQSEFGFGPRQLEDQHREWSRRWLEELLGTQSRVVATVDAQRLMTFCSA